MLLLFPAEKRYPKSRPLTEEYFVVERNKRLRYRMVFKRKTAILLMAIGILLPAVSLIFVSGYDPKAPVTTNFHEMEIVFRENTWVQPSSIDEFFMHLKDALFNEKTMRFGNTILKRKIAIHFKTIFLLGMYMVSVGAGILAVSDRSGVYHYKKT